LLNTLKNSPLCELGEKAYREFGDLGDYIWKSPRLIEHEKNIEIKKLSDYFPFTGDKDGDAEALTSRFMRWYSESKKLSYTFPTFIANGNLFSSASLFETFCLTLARGLEFRTGVPLSGIRGSGITRLLSYFTTVGVCVDEIPLVRQIRACIKVRNCLFHASGLLAMSKDEIEIRKIVQKCEFLTDEHKNMSTKLNKTIDDIVIDVSDLGDRVKINNKYAFIANSYFRNYFIGLCFISNNIVDSE
jgi:hypothetical protein